VGEEEVMAQVVCFDIDGVLTQAHASNQEDLAGTWAYVPPNQANIALARQAYEQGWYVLLFTGRRESFRGTTEEWLCHHKVPYHALVMGKPYFTFIVDDRARSPEELKRVLDEEAEEMV
jgi:hypothetical protein